MFIDLQVYVHVWHETLNYEFVIIKLRFLCKFAGYINIFTQGIKYALVIVIKTLPHCICVRWTCACCVFMVSRHKPCHSFKQQWMNSQFSDVINYVVIVMMDDCCNFFWWWVLNILHFVCIVSWSHSVY